MVLGRDHRRRTRGCRDLQRPGQVDEPVDRRHRDGDAEHGLQGRAQLGQAWIGPGQPVDGLAQVSPYGRGRRLDGQGVVGQAALRARAIAVAGTAVARIDGEGDGHPPMIRPGRGSWPTRVCGGARYRSGVAQDCLFCSMVAGDIPVDPVYSDDAVIAFADINPQAPTHVLVVPRTHVRDLAELAADADLSARVLAGIRATVEALGVEQFRTVFNTGAGAGQSVFHVHAHVLAGRPFSWPPG